ncbi:G-box-binding factor 3 [Citrus sinensis]|uniref:G-box-binding factor 3 n=1 Tax=Citrus sinensis TaxID=2711 RepID=A0ACB8MPQ6_CITSI|nr:G-box-binding factor 3 [Citrus sinensis]KAH9732389.1 G-box-binding factor 3 [Citrus sinensis]KAH9787613.1 G-box-binding factor 3 [Citrus sinensis]
MGNNEDGKSFKSEKPSSPPPSDQGNIHMYTDWAAMQAYYGPRVAIPPYYNSPIASGHAPQPYMWGPAQPMMPPYGAPYAAIYSTGGVYAHPAVPLAVTPLNTEAPTKSSGNADRGLAKKLKGLDGLAMSIGNASAESAEGGAEQRPSQSEADGSTDGSDGNTVRAGQSRKKRSREGTPIAGKPVGPVLSPGMPTKLELRNAPGMNVKASPTSVPQPCAVLPPETWIQNERELKRERRKQSNRESARRSRLRKQAEAEELSRKVDSLIDENASLKSEINQLSENSEKLRQENAALLEKLKSAQLGNKQEIVLNEDKRVTPVSTENLLSRVNNSGTVDRNMEEGGHLFEKNSNSGAKLHQLLDASPRTDAVAAG